jgi:hypothetical protein
MSACIFVGPTLRREEVAAVIDDAVCLPPAAQADIYRAARSRRPRAIGVIDGYFCGAPSIWHKEILWALSEGIHVFGSASMGALRAAELDAFGMRGVGRIFEDFRDGRLEDDDEVAISHGPAETGYLALSEPMVNIRATLQRAQAANLLCPAACDAIEQLAKSTFFAERRWRDILARVPAEHVTEAEVGALQAWLNEGQVDQKREDAIAMLHAMRQTMDRPGRFQPAFRFERTHFWDELTGRIAHEENARAAAGPDVIAARAVTEELRLQGAEIYGQVRSRALLRWFTQHTAPPSPVDTGSAAIGRRLAGLRAEHGLYDRAALNAWLERNHLDEAALEQLLRRDVRAQAAAADAVTSLDHALVDELRLSGAYAALAERAGHKRDVLTANGMDLLAATAAASGPIGPRAWYFGERLGQSMPDDIAGFSRELGFDSLAKFNSALRREKIYSTLVHNVSALSR